MTVTERKEMKNILREVVREELAARQEELEMPISSRQVLAITGWSYSKLKRLKATLGAWKNPSGDLMFLPSAIRMYLRTPQEGNTQNILY